MTMTIELPAELAHRMNLLFRSEELGQFAIAAIEDAVYWKEVDSRECIAGVQEGLRDFETGRSISLAEEKVRWNLHKTQLLAKSH